MQEYSKRSKNGDAGEYFSAFKFTKLFGWPYRMLDVDMGVDAEIELLNDKGISTSDIIKVQIKTFDSINSEDSKKIYVSPDHIEYWKRFCVPIIVVCVDLNNEKIYWKPVIATESYQSGGQSNVISIDLKVNELTAASKNLLTRLAVPDESKDIERWLDDVRVKYENVINQPTVAVDGKDLNAIEQAADEFRKSLNRLEEIIRHFPWRVGLLTLREIDMMKYNVRVTQNNAHHSHAVYVNGM